MTPQAPVTLSLVGLLALVRSICGFFFGALTLIVALAVLAAIPVVQFLTLGYLLEAGGRVGGSGRLRDGFPGIRKASRFGGAMVGGAIVLIPLWVLSDLHYDARLIDPDSAVTRQLATATGIVGVLAFVHIGAALALGGRLRWFLFPLSVVRLVVCVSRGSYVRQTWRGGLAFVRGLRLAHYWSLGLRGWIGAAAWLAVPTALLGAAALWVNMSGPATVLLAVFGAVAMVVVLLYLPFLQERFAVENRLAAMFEVRAVRDRFARAPIACFLALLFTLPLVLPLYLFKIEMLPRDAWWLVSLVFIVTIFPLKLLLGWAYARGGRHPQKVGAESRAAPGMAQDSASTPGPARPAGPTSPRFPCAQEHPTRPPAHFLLRLAARLATVPVAAFYTLIVFFIPYVSWYGAWGLFDQHAFLLPVPF